MALRRNIESSWVQEDWMRRDGRGVRRFRGTARRARGCKRSEALFRATEGEREAGTRYSQLLNVVPCEEVHDGRVRYPSVSCHQEHPRQVTLGHTREHEQCQLVENSEDKQASAPPPTFDPRPARVIDGRFLVR